MSEEEERKLDSQYGPLCTFAVTGSKPHFQAIYLCHTCSSSSSSSQKDTHPTSDTSSGRSGDINDTKVLPLCICQNCAFNCHEELGHEIEYIGDGPSYCDCSSINNNNNNINPNNLSGGCNNSSSRGCILQEESRKVAMKLNIRNSDGIICSDLGINVELQPKSSSSNCSSAKFPFICDVFDLPQIYPCDGLVEQALELIKHTRDTHWVSLQNHGEKDGECNSSNNFDDLCELEQLACSIFLRHVESYNLKNFIENTKYQDFGVEWWVQVKEVVNSDENEEDGDMMMTNRNEAIDLHYDKDEELAASFDIGSFPTLSTVTYLTDGPFGKDMNGHDVSAPPTLIFAHTHEMVNDGPLGRHLFTDENEVKDSPQLLVCHAREGKHLCFDGHLLHGAASNIALRKAITMKGETVNSVKNQGLRVTFLVNIWLTRRPSRVITLPDSIRSALKTCSISPVINSIHPLLMHPRKIHECRIGGDERNDPSSALDRIKLPFVSNNATWIDRDEDLDDNEKETNLSGLVVSMVPPPQIDSDIDTIAFFYDQEMEPKLEYIEEDDDDEEEDDEEDEEEIDSR